VSAELDRTAEDVEAPADLGLVGCNGVEIAGQATLRRCVGRKLIHVGALEHAQPVVPVPVDVQHLRVAQNQIDRGQELRSLQAVAVEILRTHVRRCCERDAAGEERGEEIAQDHRIGDVADDELVEANDAGPVGETVGHAVERVCKLFELAEIRVHRGHETMEMPAYLVLEGQRAIKEIHEHGLAAADAPPQVDAVRRRTRLGVHETFELAPPAASRGSGADQLGIEALERLRRTLLGDIGFELPARHARVVDRKR